MNEGLANVKIFGERNSATTALKQLIERNSRSRVLPSVAEELDARFHSRMRILARLPLGPRLAEHYIDSVFSRQAPCFSWKHTATEFNDIASFRDCIVVLLVRHPASWLLAFHRKPYHVSGPKTAPFSEFVGTKLQTVKRDNLGGRSLPPTELWNTKVRSYVAFSKQMMRAGIPFRWVLFEDFVRDQSIVFETLRDLLASPAQAASIVTQSTKEKSKSYLYYREYYGRERWLAEIDEQSRLQIDEAVDWDLAASFGYRPLSELSHH